ncbi:MAG: acyltransferase [Opitutaceae bacterium]|nr:acyltransferase [Opitutaceae bacterium]
MNPQPEKSPEPELSPSGQPTAPESNNDPHRRGGVGFLIITLGVIFLAVAGVLAVIDYRTAEKSNDVACVLTLTNRDYAKPFTTDAITFSNSQLENRIRISAPLDNSWIYVSVSALDRAGREVTRLEINLSYYSGSSDGRWWWTGSKSETRFLTLPTAGDYQFRLSIRAAAGASKVHDPTRIAEPLRVEILRGEISGVRTRVLGFIALSFLGAALILQGVVKLPPKAKGSVDSTQVISTANRHGRQPAGDRMVFIDGLRGIACLSVLACHLFVPELSGIVKPLTAVLPAIISWAAHHGHLGVEIFFVLSGFVIAYSLRRHRICTSLALRFVLRRSVRLDPPYYVALIVAAGIAALRYPDSLREVSIWLGGLPGMLANGFYLQDLLRFRALISVAWTLCLEIQFYLAYFLLLWVAQTLGKTATSSSDASRKKVDALCLLAVAGPIAIWSVYTWYPDARNLSFAGTWFRFFLGALTFWASQVRFLRPVLVGAALCVGIVSALTADSRGGVAAATALLIFFASETGHLTRWLAGYVWQHLGRISYSLYLAHVVVGLPLMNWIWGAVPHSPAWAGLMAVVGIAASLGAAELLHRLIEAPALRLSQRIRYS